MNPNLNQAQTKNILGHDGSFKHGSFSVKPSQKKLMKGHHGKASTDAGDYTEASHGTGVNITTQSQDQSNRSKHGGYSAHQQLTANINASQSSVLTGKSGSVNQHKTSFNDEMTNEEGIPGINNSVDQGSLTKGGSGYKVNSILRGEGKHDRNAMTQQASNHRQGNG